MATKDRNIASFDPLTGDLTRFYNPRAQQWDDHFELHVDTTIVGLTQEGRHRRHSPTELASACH